MTELSVGGMRDGIEEQLKRAAFLKELSDPEAESAIGQEIAEKIAEGFSLFSIIFPVFAPFFTSTVEEIALERKKFVEENGGSDKIEFYLIPRTGEVIVLLKPNPI